MPRDLDERLRRLRTVLPEPGPAATDRARAAFLGRVGRAARRRRLPLLAAAAAAAAVLAAAIGAAALVGERAADPQSTGAAVCPRTFPSFLVEFGQWGLGSDKELFAIAGSLGADRPGGYVMWASATPNGSASDRTCVPTSLQRNPDRTRLGPPLRYLRTDTGNVYFRGGGQQFPSVRLHRRSIDAVANRLAFGIDFICVLPARIVVHTQPLRERGGREIGRHFSVRAESSNALLATANLYRSQPSFFRISSRCDRRSS